MTTIHDKKIDFVCINVPTNTKRRAHMERNRDEHGIPLRFFSAITPETLDMVESDYQQARARRWQGRALIPTERACALSHIYLWRQFLRSGNDYLMVFEDDVRIMPEFMRVVSAVLKLSAPPDFIKFSGLAKHPRPSVKKQELGVGEYTLFLNAYGPIDAACYMLCKTGAWQMERYCRRMHLAIDTMMDRSYEHGAACYCVLPYPAPQIEEESGVFTSQIGVAARKNKYDHNNVMLKAITRCLRVYTSLRKRWAILKLKIGG